MGVRAPGRFELGQLGAREVCGASSLRQPQHQRLETGGRDAGPCCLCQLGLLLAATLLAIGLPRRETIQQTHGLSFQVDEREGDLIVTSGDFCAIYFAVGNKAVQEVTSAVAYYRGDEGWVITNSSFTPSAKALAQKSHIKLIDGKMLKEGGLDRRSPSPPKKFDTFKSPN